MHEVVLDEILEERVVSSRGKRNKRGVKRKMSNYPIRAKAPTLTLWSNIVEHVQVLK